MTHDEAMDRLLNHAEYCLGDEDRRALRFLQDHDLKMMWALEAVEEEIKKIDDHALLSGKDIKEKLSAVINKALTQE